MSVKEQPSEWDGITERRIDPAGKLPIAVQVGSTLARRNSQGIREIPSDVMEALKIVVDTDTRFRDSGAFKGQGPKTRAALLRILKGLNNQSNEQDEGSEVEEAVEVDLRLNRFQDEYQHLPVEQKNRCSWEKFQYRMLANEERFLVLAKAMNGGGILFGIDRQGNPLIADVAEDPRDLPYCGLDYNATDNAVYSTGYEMFPEAEHREKSEEVQMFETNTGKLFVQSRNGRQWVASWLKYNEKCRTIGRQPTSVAPFVRFYSRSKKTQTGFAMPNIASSRRGVRRLLRVRGS